MQISLYTDGACSGNPGAGGYAAILVATEDDGTLINEKEVSGGERHTTNNRMEIKAVIAGLMALTTPTPVTIYSDSQYVIYTMTKGWQRKANQDLWAELDAALKPHKVKWKYVRGHAGHEYNERCDKIARQAIQTLKQSAERERS